MAWCRIGAKALSSKCINETVQRCMFKPLKSLMSRESGKHYAPEMTHMGVSITFCWFWCVIDDLLLRVALIINLRFINDILRQICFDPLYKPMAIYITTSMFPNWHFGSIWRFITMICSSMIVNKSMSYFTSMLQRRVCMSVEIPQCKGLWYIMAV